ncbi:MAG: hypothetical protein KAG82_11970 [Alcanivoracaceae bacterium]|jgi:hypothetical protein|nr:hypothetical protein [Alcanivoracaceae bacterium]
MKTVMPWLLLAISQQVTAHSIPTGIGEPQLQVAMAVTARSAGAVESDQYWRIPGVMMGGHAWPAQQGLNADELSLSFSYRMDENLFAVIKAGQQDGHDNGAVEIEHAWLGYVCCGDTGPLVIEVGKMSATFTPSVSEHSSARIFADASLPADAFLGRHFHDQGMRLWRHNPQGFSTGIELWQGHAFPATAGEDGGAADVFASLQHRSGRFSLHTGVWALFARADQRADHRYSEEHSHGGLNNTPPADIRFTGDSLLSGVHALLGWQLNSRQALQLRLEWMQVDADGWIEDETRRADLDGQYQGVVVQPEWVMGRHLFALRAEQLSLDNYLSGAAALPLAEDANLITGHNPWRLGAGWRWQWRKAVALRADLTRDASLGSAENRVAIGLLWQQALTSGAGHH